MRGGLRVIVMSSRWLLLRGLLGANRLGQDRSGGRRFRRWSCGLRCCVNRLGWVRLGGWFGCCGPVIGGELVCGVSVDRQRSAPSVRRSVGSVWPDTRIEPWPPSVAVSDSAPMR